MWVRRLNNEKKTFTTVPINLHIFAKIYLRNKIYLFLLDFHYIQINVICKIKYTHLQYSKSTISVIISSKQSKRTPELYIKSEIKSKVYNVFICKGTKSDNFHIRSIPIPALCSNLLRVYRLISSLCFPVSVTLTQWWYKNRAPTQQKLYSL